MSDAPLAILNEDGSCADEHRGLIDDASLLRVLDVMALNRAMDARLIALQRQGRLGFYMTSKGEEATTIGAAFCLRGDDPIFLTYRELGSILWRGVPLPEIANQLIGNIRDRSKGRQMPIHYCFREWAIPSVSSPVGTQLPHATGFAYAAKLRGTEQVALAFLGEGTASEGDFHTAVNFAGAFGVPAVFVIRNNGYAISTPESVQTAAPSLAARGIGYGVPGVQVDGNDFLAVIYAMSEAVARARRGEGPTLIEALTYRMGAHSTADDPSAYRDDEEAERWSRLDPQLRLRRHARWRGLWSDEREAEIEARYEREIKQLIAECEPWPPPPLDWLFEDVTQVRGAQLEAQRAAYLRFWQAQQSRVDEVP